MNKDQLKRVFLVDDDVLFLKILQTEFSVLKNYIIETFESGEECLANISKNPDIIILDYHLNAVNSGAMNGIAVLDKIKAFNIHIPVIILSSQDKIEVAVSCMHHCAFDYVVKSETAFFRLQKVMKTYFQIHKLEKKLEWYMERM